MDFEKLYYDNEKFWEKEVFSEDEKENGKFKSCISMIPEDIDSLLDVGAGNGYFLYLLENELKFKKILLSGVDRSSVAANMRVCKSHIAVEDIKDLKNINLKYDIVTSTEVLEHIPYVNYKESLHALECISNKYILISVPYKEERDLVKCPYCGAFFDHDYHMRTYDEKIMEELFEGFFLKKIIFCGMTSEYSKLYRFLVCLYDDVKGRDMYVNDRCPQCGYLKDDNKNFHKISLARNILLCMIKIFKRITRVFLSHKPIWVIALYEKK